ncbi:MAG: hypothetical protein JWN94_990 [Betaproteobacteria bacterium]|nr:hypothetical protein [Betaproteobacteria bacterium]
MTLVRVLVAIFVLGSSLPLVALADDLTPEKRVDIERLLKMTGALSLGKQMAVSIVAQLNLAIKKARPDVPQKLMDALPEEVSAVFDENIATFKEAVIPMYSKYFTAIEIKQMVQFYSTDLGQKVIKIMPALMQESMAIGQAWGQSLGPRIDARIKARFKQEGITI